MDIENYLKKMAEIQNNIINYIDNEQVDENDFGQIVKSCDNYKILEDKHDFKLILYLILSISDNHHRYPNFFDKIFKILKHYQDYIQKNFTNNEIFNIFKRNKRILLFLFEEKIISLNNLILLEIQKFKNENYEQFFIKEIKSFINDESKTIDEIPSDFEEKRRIGENDDYICQLIQKDKVEEFITYVNKTNLSIKNYKIEPSIYETNSFLLDKQPSLIEYSAFFGSIQILKYLFMNEVEMSLSVFFYAIHGHNPELIHFLEENYNIDRNYSANLLLNEAIKCNHSDIANYIINQYCRSETLLSCIESYNFNFMIGKTINQSNINDLCKYDYYNIVKSFLNGNDIDINDPIIYHYNFYCVFF